MGTTGHTAGPAAAPQLKQSTAHSNGQGTREVRSFALPPLKALPLLELADRLPPLSDPFSPRSDTSCPDDQQSELQDFTTGSDESAWDECSGVSDDSIDEELQGTVVDVAPWPLINPFPPTSVGSLGALNTYHSPQHRTGKYLPLEHVLSALATDLSPAFDAVADGQQQGSSSSKTLACPLADAQLQGCSTSLDGFEDITLLLLASQGATAPCARTQPPSTGAPSSSGTIAATPAGAVALCKAATAPMSLLRFLALEEQQGAGACARPFPLPTPGSRSSQGSQSMHVFEAVTSYLTGGHAPHSACSLPEGGVNLQHTEPGWVVQLARALE